jgi:hypothetical protein
MKEAPGSSETSVLTRATRRNIPEDTILHSHRRENLKSYTWSLIQSANYTHMDNFNRAVRNMLFPLEPNLRLSLSYDTTKREQHCSN